jgi:hypothetical protein
VRQEPHCDREEHKYVSQHDHLVKKPTKIVARADAAGQARGKSSQGRKAQFLMRNAAATSDPVASAIQAAGNLKNNSQIIHRYSVIDP